MGRYEERHSKRLRRRALASVLEHLRYEDEVTGFLDIGPVNKVLNAFVHAFRGAGDGGAEDFRRAFAACDDYLWDAADGTTKMQGYNNSKLWDTAFATQAILRAGAVLGDGVPVADTEPTLARAHGYLRDNQILEDVRDAARHFRHASRGGWPFSTRAHGWPITDCTSEGLKCALALEGRYQPAIPGELLEDAVRLILSWQNLDGGWATYEKQRGGPWLELLNPSQVFGDIMVDYSYVECTSACLQALAAARPRHRNDHALGAEIDRGHRAGRLVHPYPAAPGRQLRGQVGRLFHLRGVVRGERVARGGRGSERSGHRPRLRLPPLEAAERRRVGRARRLVPHRPLRAGGTLLGGADLVGAVDPVTRDAPLAPGAGPSCGATRLASGGRRELGEGAARRRVQSYMPHRLRQLPALLPAMGAGGVVRVLHQPVNAGEELEHLAAGDLAPAPCSWSRVSVRSASSTGSEVKAR